MSSISIFETGAGVNYAWPASSLAINRVFIGCSDISRRLSHNSGCAAEIGAKRGSIRQVSVTTKTCSSTVMIYDNGRKAYPVILHFVPPASAMDRRFPLHRHQEPKSVSAHPERHRFSRQKARHRTGPNASLEPKKRLW